jgi:hypothetical protein
LAHSKFFLCPTFQPPKLSSIHATTANGTTTTETKTAHKTIALISSPLERNHLKLAVRLDNLRVIPATIRTDEHIGVIVLDPAIISPSVPSNLNGQIDRPALRASASVSTVLLFYHLCLSFCVVSTELNTLYTIVHKKSSVFIRMWIIGGCDDLLY